MRLLVVLLTLFIVGCSTLPGSKTIETDFGQSKFYLSGSTKPTVIFEAGLGDNMTTWQSVIEQMKSTTQVLAYNRAGFSGSESRNEARNAEVIALELRNLLATLDLAPPYVLVGHSLGGGYMELFARRYPTDVLAVVLVDPNSSKYPQRCKAAALDFCDPPSSIPTWASWLLPSAVEGEIKGFASTHEQINAIDDFPDVPLVVLTAGATRAGETEKQQQASDLYLKMHQELALASPRSKLVSCESCGHYIQNERPDLVVDAIHWAISESRKHASLNGFESKP